MKKDFFFGIVLFLCSVCLTMKCYAQTNKSNFSIEGHVIGRDTGSIAIWYRNADNKFRRDTIALNHGKFSLSGTVSGATEALVWTDIRNIFYDHHSVIRFILVPGLIKISKTNGLEIATISGSRAQAEKEQWDKVKLPFTAADDRCLEIADSLRKLDRSAGQPFHKKRIDSLYRVSDSIRAICVKLDVDYVEKHPNSYLSMYLLSRRCKKIPLDSVVQLYSAFPDSVKRSSLAYEVLSYVYPLTDNKEFRMKNPLYGAEFNKRLMQIGSMHDFRLKDVSGKVVDFKTFKGKYLVLDVWASWCKPCIANMPAWNDLMKQYDPGVIQFISVSVDDDVAAWKESVAKHKPGGIQVVDSNAFAGVFAVYSRIAYVPRYLIVDPAGQIINYEAPHPRAPALRNLLNDLVKREN